MRTLLETFLTILVLIGFSILIGSEIPALFESPLEEQIKGAMDDTLGFAVDVIRITFTVLIIVDSTRRLLGTTTELIELRIINGLWLWREIRAQGLEDLTPEFLKKIKDELESVGKWLGEKRIRKRDLNGPINL